MIQKMIRYTCDGCLLVDDRTDDRLPSNWIKVRLEGWLKVEHRLLCPICFNDVKHHFLELRKSHRL